MRRSRVYAHMCVRAQAQACGRAYTRVYPLLILYHKILNLSRLFCKFFLKFFIHIFVEKWKKLSTYLCISSLTWRVLIRPQIRQSFIITHNKAKNTIKIFDNFCCNFAVLSCILISVKVTNKTAAVGTMATYHIEKETNNMNKLSKTTLKEFINNYRKGGTIVLTGNGQYMDFYDWTNAEILNDVRQQRKHNTRRIKYYMVQGLTDFKAEQINAVDKLNWTLDMFIEWLYNKASDVYDYKTGAHIRQAIDINQFNKVTLGIWNDYKGNIYIDLGIIIYADNKKQLKAEYERAKDYFRAPEQKAVYILNTFSGIADEVPTNKINKAWN